MNKQLKYLLLLNAAFALSWMCRAPAESVMFLANKDQQTYHWQFTDDAERVLKPAMISLTNKDQESANEPGQLHLYDLVPEGTEKKCITLSFKNGLTKTLIQKCLNGKTGCHYLISYDGEIINFLDTDKASGYTQGFSARSNIINKQDHQAHGYNISQNNISIVLEYNLTSQIGNSNITFTENQLNSLRQLIVYLTSKYNIKPLNIFGLEDTCISPDTGILSMQAVTDPLPSDPRLTWPLLPGNLFPWGDLNISGTKDIVATIYPEDQPTLFNTNPAEVDDNESKELFMDCLQKLGYYIPANWEISEYKESIFSGALKAFKNHHSLNIKIPGNLKFSKLTTFDIGMALALCNKYLAEYDPNSTDYLSN